MVLGPERCQPIAAIAFVVPLRYATTTYAEAFALPVVLAATYRTARDMEQDSPAWTRTGALWAFAVLIRSDVVSLALVAAVVAWRVNKDRRALSRIFLPALIALAIPVVSSSLFGPVSYLNVRGTYREYASSWKAIDQLVAVASTLYSGWQWVLWVLAAFGIFYALRSVTGKLVSALWVTALLQPFLLPVLGMAQVADRYFHPASGLAALLVGSAVARAFARPDGNVRWLPVLLLPVALVSVGWVAQDSVTHAHRGVFQEDVKQTQGWLRDNIRQHEHVHFDFIRFYGAYLRADLLRTGERWRHFDYTAYYTSIPETTRPDWSTVSGKTTRERVHARIRATAEHYLLTNPPDVIVVPSPAFARRLELEAPGMQAIQLHRRSTNEDAGASVTIHGRRYSLAASFGRFEIYRRP